MAVKILFFLSAFFFLHAAPIGNGAAPALIRESLVFPDSFWLDARAGYIGDFVGNANLEQAPGGAVDHFQQYTNSASATCNLYNRLDLFGTFGSSRVSADWRFANENTITRIQFETLYHFLWSAGARGIVFEGSLLCFSLGGCYTFCSYPPSWASANGTPMDDLSNVNLRWRQWQADCAISYKIDLLTPYLGLKYSDAAAYLTGFPDPIATGFASSVEFQNKNSVGLILGCSISNGRYFMLNVEGRFIDEYALSLSGDLRF